MTRTVGKVGMGSHKHGISGVPGHSPRYKHAMKREAEANERKAKKSREPLFSTPSEAIKNFKPK